MGSSSPQQDFLVTLISAGDMSGSLVSPSQSLDTVIGYAIQAVWTGSPTGTFSVSGSLDNVSYTQITSTPTGGSAGSFLLNVEKPMYGYLQVSCSAGGTGSLTVKIVGKVE